MRSAKSMIARQTQDTRRLTMLRTTFPDGSFDDENENDVGDDEEGDVQNVLQLPTVRMQLPKTASFPSQSIATVQLRHNAPEFMSTLQAFVKKHDPDRRGIAPHVRDRIDVYKRVNIVRSEAGSGIIAKEAIRATPPSSTSKDFNFDTALIDSEAVEDNPKRPGLHCERRIVLPISRC